MASSDIKPYPFMFDPSQFSDPYSSYNNMALPFMGQYSGTPTDAHGNPIGSYQAAQAAHDAWTPPAQAAAPMAPSTTLNSLPQPTMSVQQASAQGLNDPSTWQRGGLNAAQWASLSGPQKASYYGPMGVVGYSNQVDQGHGGGADYEPIYGRMPPQAAPQAAPQAPPTNPIDMNQAYLAALSNPGKVTTPGATVPQANLPSGQSGVLQQFLQNWQQGGGNTQGAGAYNNRGFFAGLQGGQ